MVEVLVVVGIVAVLIAIAVRTRQLPERLSAALERAQAAGRLIRVELGGLSYIEARELLGPDVGDGDATQLYRGSGGNPFYLEQLARSHHRAPICTLPPANRCRQL